MRLTSTQTSRIRSDCFGGLTSGNPSFRLLRFGRTAKRNTCAWVVLMERSTASTRPEKRSHHFECCSQQQDLTPVLCSPQIWTFQTEKPVFSSPCVSEMLACVAIGSHDGHIYCLGLQTGHLIWKAQCHSPVYSSPFILTSPLTESGTPEHGLVVGASTQGTVWILDFRNKGSPVASVNLQGEIFSSPVCEVVNDQECQILIGSRNNHLYSLHITQE